MKKSSYTSASDAVKQNNNQTSQDQTNLSENYTITQEASKYASEAQTAENQNNKKRDKPLKAFGAVCIALFIVSMILTFPPSVDTSDTAKNALADRVSTSLPAGTRLLANDENIGQQDYRIVHNYDKDDTKIWVWDYAAEDGDYVQVLVNGTPVTDAFMIKHKPVEIIVPSEGKFR